MLPTYPLENLKQLKPFNVALLGMRRCGKSFATSKLAKYMLHEFDLIVTFLGTAHCNPELIEFVTKHYDPRLCFNMFNVDVINKLCEQQENLADMGISRNVLICFDDCFTNNKHAEDSLSHLFIRGRHFNISTIISAVSYVSINKNCRRSLDCIFLYSSVCKSDLDTLMKEYIHSKPHVAKYCIQNLPIYTALVVETKRNQQLYELKFKKPSLHYNESSHISEQEGSLCQPEFDQTTINDSSNKTECQALSVTDSESNETEHNPS